MNLGYYADMKTGCRFFHICTDDGVSSNGIRNSFACPSGTFFSQVNTVCQWHADIDCSRSQMFYPQHSSQDNGNHSGKNNGKTAATSPPTPPPLRTQIPAPSIRGKAAGHKRETLLSPPEMRPPFRPVNRNPTN